MAEHDDLEVLGTTRADNETGQHDDEAVENARHRRSASAVFPLIRGHDRIFGPHTLLAGTTSADRYPITLGDTHTRPWQKCR